MCTHGTSGRIGSDCQHKWTAMRQVNLRKGPFSEEEDQLIIRRVREWGNKGPGLWVAIERETGEATITCYCGTALVTQYCSSQGGAATIAIIAGSVF